MKPNETPIVIKRPKHGHAHHGGAWKVAYADFVTAMMALFIVLWLTNSSEPVKQAVGGYFKDPSSNGKDTGTTKSGKGEALTVQTAKLEQLKKDLHEALKSLPELTKVLQQQVEMTVTGEGLRIELLESEKATFFESGNANPTPAARILLAAVAHQVGAMKNKVYLEGHTDSRPFAGAGGYGNWELSADRANMARKIMQTQGLRADQVSQVRGFADQRLKVENDPENSKNRRVSLIVRYEDAPAAPASSPAHGAPGASGHGATGTKHSAQAKEAHHVPPAAAHAGPPSAHKAAPAKH